LEQYDEDQNLFPDWVPDITRIEIKNAENLFTSKGVHTNLIGCNNNPGWCENNMKSISRRFGKIREQAEKFSLEKEIGLERVYNGILEDEMYAVCYLFLTIRDNEFGRINTIKFRDYSIREDSLFENDSFLDSDSFNDSFGFSMEGKVPVSDLEREVGRLRVQVKTLKKMVMLIMFESKQGIIELINDIW
jgi:hypothetical protein